jgi:enamine deaminase RidA (YjgF/YER057c/UK114 family)
VAAGSDIDKVVKVNIFLGDMNDFAVRGTLYTRLRIKLPQS